MKRILTTGMVILLFLLPAMMISAQNSLKLRISGSTTRFMSEPQGTEIDHPDLGILMNGSTLTPTQFTKFTHKGNMGYEAELMISLSDKVYLGVEVGQDFMSGFNDTPGLYNFQLTKQLQLKEEIIKDDIPVTQYLLTQAPLKYNTNLLNLIGNFRVYPAPDGRFRPFLKVSAGMALVSTELALKVRPQSEESDPELNPDLPEVLFSRGTSGAPKGREPALVLGGGIGFELQLTDRIALYADGSYRMVNSSILDGKPNFDWDENPDYYPDPDHNWELIKADTRGDLQPFKTRSTISKLTFGLVYSLGDNLSIGGGGGSSKGRQIGGGSSKSLPHLPFFKLKKL